MGPKNKIFNKATWHLGNQRGSLMLTKTIHFPKYPYSLHRIKKFQCNYGTIYLFICLF